MNQGKTSLQFIITCLETLENLLTSDRFNQLEVGQAEIKGEIKTSDEKLSGQIKIVDEKSTGRINTLIKILNLNIMGESKRRKQLLGSNYGTVKQKLTKGSFANTYNSLKDFVQHSTEQNGRGYVACGQHGCKYYPESDFLGDEDDFLLSQVRDYNPRTEAIVVAQVSLGDAMFSTRVVPLQELEQL